MPCFVPSVKPHLFIGRAFEYIFSSVKSFWQPWNWPSYLYFTTLDQKGHGLRKTVSDFDWIPLGEHYQACDGLCMAEKGAPKQFSILYLNLPGAMPLLNVSWTSVKNSLCELRGRSAWNRNLPCTGYSRFSQNSVIFPGVTMENS